MMKRKGLSKKIRFEVFKRDSFTCQYCGKKAPDVILHCDHMNPVAKGGTNDILNLITACENCNLGKSDRKLTDNTTIDKQRSQLESLQERKEQIELMFEWQRELLNINETVIEHISNYWTEQCDGYSLLTKSGLRDIKTLIKSYEISEILKAINIATEKYIVWNDHIPENTSVELAWKKVGGICRINKLEKDGGHLKRTYYIRGILRNRCGYVNDKIFFPLIKKCLITNISINSIEKLSKE